MHVLAVYDGNFPACMSAGTSEQIDEERRLLYVGMTRARRTSRSTCPSATTTARTAATTRTATASRPASSRPRCSPPATSRAFPDDPLNPYGAPIVTNRRLNVTPDALFD